MVYPQVAPASLTASRQKAWRRLVLPNGSTLHTTRSHGSGRPASSFCERSRKDTHLCLPSSVLCVTSQRQPPSFHCMTRPQPVLPLGCSQVALAQDAPLLRGSSCTLLGTQDVHFGGSRAAKPQGTLPSNTADAIQHDAQWRIRVWAAPCPHQHATPSSLFAMATLVYKSHCGW